MSPAQLALLEQLKALREGRAAAAAGETAAALRAAEDAVQRARRTARSFATLRHVRATAIARRLGDGPKAPGAVAAGQAELLSLAARAGTFAARIDTAEAGRLSADQADHAAKARHQAALRRLEAWRALIETVARRDTEAAEAAAEQALEEAATRRQPGLGAWTG